MDIMGYIQDNYVWIIIVAIVVIMTIIGYIAEKKDFGNTSKDKKVKENKPENIVESKEEFAEQPIEEIQNEMVNPVEEIVIPNDNLLNSFDMDSNLNELETIEEPTSAVLDNSEGMYNFEDDDLFNMNYEESKVEDNIVSLEQENAIDEVESNPEQVIDPNAEIFELEEQKPNVEEISELEVQEEVDSKPTEYNNLEVEEISELPLQDTSLELENLNSEENNDLEIELPNIDTLNEEIKDVIDEDDVWKF